MVDDDLIDGVLTFEETTEGIHIAVQSYYLAEQSKPEAQQFVWAYRIRITNEAGQPVQLLNRHWMITDANGGLQEVKGVGVIGEQPVIRPGDTYIYTSGTPLSTPSGFMRGSYEMQRDDGVMFNAQVPAFSLDSPHVSLHIN
ncbi:Co2+/Mg2+ efflux protein ApaG [Kordiimonas aestuarii]|uniref:Co2+/Mg2+ efflux protein ApaG n=1 Tax=Kordiimonas aestuarii TaxID=1005925 RepID=UPI0021CEB18B|nr:Co2+/Mg2+ efflux protein ApaG [Kordiimonas aestuarii]